MKESYELREFFIQRREGVLSPYDETSKGVKRFHLFHKSIITLRDKHMDNQRLTIY